MSYYRKGNFMEDIYKFELDNDMFEKLLSGKKTAQLVINESKRKNP